MNKATNLVDRIAATASLACAIECAVLPFVMAILPFAGLTFLQHPAWEAGFLCVVLALGGWSLRRGLIRTHKNPGPVIVFACAFLVIAFGHLFLDGMGEEVLHTSGGFMFAGSAFWNLALNRSHGKACCTKHAHPPSGSETYPKSIHSHH